MTSPATTSTTSDSAEKRQDIRFAEKDAALRSDVRALGKMVGELLLEQGGEALYKTVESARQLAIERRESDTVGTSKLDDLLGNMSAAAARDIVRAFSTYFQVVNTAEQVHRIRRRRDYLKDTSMRQPRSLDATFQQLSDAGFEPAAVDELLKKISIEPVFTPHPTETTRRTILRKHQNIVRRMVDMQNPALTPQEVNACFESIRADITAIWQTEESPVDDTTVFDELEHTLFFMTDVIYRVIPPFYEALTGALNEIYGDDHQLKAPNLLHFSSWTGGDISTNSEISARTIREVMARQQSLLLDLYYRDCKGLAEKLSQSLTRIDVDSAIKKRIEKYSNQFPGVNGSTPHRYRNMPYRLFLRLIMQRLKATYDESAFPYESAEQFIADLKLITRSLAKRKGSNAGMFAVKRLIRRAETFGFHLLSLDIRYNAHELQDVVGYCLGESDWLSQSPEYRAERITHVLEINDSPSVEPDNDAKRLLSVFRAISYCQRRYGDRAIGVFLVRHCHGIDDILAVLLLGRWAGMHGSSEGTIPLDISPAFETSTELAECGELVSQLLNNSSYRGHLTARDEQQIVMLSTAGASADGGVAASRWNMQRAHTNLGEVFQQHNIDYTLFHGRGSFSGRGGVADSIACGHLRATEHGESVNERYGVRGIAFRTLEKAFSTVATATAGLDDKPAATDDWSAIMGTLATDCDQLYQQLVGSDSSFEEYFQLATPIDVIELMRTGQNSITDADQNSEIVRRNIPWAFAWAQSRFALPSWYGFGSGLQQSIDAHGIDMLRSMVKDWPFFRRLVTDVEIALAITDPSIAHHYSELAGDNLHSRFFPAINVEYDLGVTLINELREQKVLLKSNNTLRRSIRLRNPYVDPMSLLQVELLSRWRASNRSDATLLTALRASVNGIARGLQTSL
jgi:phosphoenolpyruvate carboxylase